MPLLFGTLRNSYHKRPYKRSSVKVHSRDITRGPSILSLKTHNMKAFCQINPTTYEVRMKRKIYDILNVAVTAKKNCYNGEVLNTKWGSKWDDLIDYLQRNHLPHGSGFDCGCKVVEEECVSGLKLVIKFDYHHMDEHGYYDGWSSHKVIVIPYFDGISVTIKGALPRKYRHSKEYFGDTLHYHLTDTIKQSKIDEILNKSEE